MDIEIRNKRNLIQRIWKGIFERRNVVYRGKYIVNHIGTTTYIDYDFVRQNLTEREIKDLFFKW